MDEHFEVFLKLFFWFSSDFSSNLRELSEQGSTEQVCSDCLRQPEKLCSGRNRIRVDPERRIKDFPPQRKKKKETTLTNCHNTCSPNSWKSGKKQRKKWKKKNKRVEHVYYPLPPACQAQLEKNTGKGKKILQTKQLSHCLQGPCLMYIPSHLNSYPLQMSPRLAVPAWSLWFPFALAPVIGEPDTPWHGDRDIPQQIYCLTLNEHGTSPGAIGSCISCGFLGKWTMVLHPENTPLR